jgi:hypothetical protein
MKNIFDGYGTFAKIFKIWSEFDQNGLFFAYFLCTMHKFVNSRRAKTGIFTPAALSLFYDFLTEVILFGQ